MAKGYKIRQYVNGRSKKGDEYTNYSLTVPNEIAEALPEDITFRARMTDEGLLYEPVTDQPRTPIELPDWAKQQNGKKEKEETKK